MFDIIIVGAGPAGSTLARLIGKKYKVLILDKRSFDKNSNSSIKSCGGLIAPDAQLMLAKFRLGIPKPVLLSPQLFAVRTIDIDNNLERYYQRHYINIDRGKFDRWLVKMIPKEVQINDKCVFKSLEEKDDKIRVKYTHNKKVYEEETKLLVGADGAFSKVRRQAFKLNSEPKLYVTIQEWFKTESKYDYYGAIFDSEITDFYSWTIPKDEHLIIGSALNPKDKVHQKFKLLKGKLKKFGYKTSNSIKVNGSYMYRPFNKNQINIGDHKIALVGEAAGFISPSSAEGLSYAFKSSLALMKALNPDIDNYHENYYKNLKPLFKNILLKNIKSPAIYNPKIRKIVMNSRLLSIKPEKIEY